MSNAQLDQHGQQARPTIFLKDYSSPDYVIETVDLHFELGEDVTQVRARLSIKRGNPDNEPRPLVLDGHDMSLTTITLDGRPLDESEYQLASEALTISNVPPSFSLEVQTALQPQNNTSLMGLYTSGGNFCTQCEAEGFRKITYSIDRPDVMARYTTTIVADKTKYPVLLSNGNLQATGESAGNRHWATWHDPHPKPSYLFALVAGDLACVSDEFLTAGGRRVALNMYVQHHNADKCEHAMASLKRAMAWDEEVYGREYDLDVYNVVAVDDFNMGAMENKGLNVFNSKYVLAIPDTATDRDYQAIEGVIAHEYFHNWSGNRVTCRDWFQLSLKEGFTVFRDQEFSADMFSRGVKRIQDVNILRTHQFREDAGPMAHPVRPPSYMEINNFYTVTVYNKGAEVVRMLYHILGPKRFRAGTDLYFSRHDGQAVTTDDFVKALADASGEDFSQFKLWYSQAGSPEVEVLGHYDDKNQTYTLTVKQLCPATPGQQHKEPFHIPVAMALLDKEGQEVALQLEGEQNAAAMTKVLSLRQQQESFVFVNIPQRPVPSLLRGFSAPVKLTANLCDDDLYFLMAHDSDEFNRWDSGQRLAVNTLLDFVSQIQQGVKPVLGTAYIEAFEEILRDRTLEKSFLAQSLTLPDEAYLTEFMKVIDPKAIHEACRAMRRQLAKQLMPLLMEIYEENDDDGPYTTDSLAMGRRSVKNVCLSYLIELDDDAIRQRCMQQFNRAANMTDVLAALQCLSNTESNERRQALDQFYEKWQDDALVMDKWLLVQALSWLPDTLDDVKKLTTHSVFNIKNPNKARALIGSFCHGNPVHFHQQSGDGYRFLTEQVLAVDSFNPQVAARLVSAFNLWKKYDEQRKSLMKEQLEVIVNTPQLSRDVYEIVSKTLAD